MSWSTSYGTSYGSYGDSFTGDDYGPPGEDGFMGSSYTSEGSQFGKRSHSPDLSQQFKKPKTFGASSGGNGYDDYSSGPTSWDQLGSKDSFGGGNFSTADEGPTSWDSLSGPTSWDQLSSDPKNTGGAPRGRGRGSGNRGGAGGRGGGGSFGTGGNFSAGNKFGEGNFGGGGNFSADDSYGNFGGGGGNFGGAGNFSGGGNFGQSNFGGGKPRGQRGAARGGGGRGQGGGGGQQFGFQPRGGRGAGRGGGGGRGGGFGGARGRPQRGRGAGFGNLGQAGKKMSLVDKFVKFGEFLRNEGVRVNSIQSIENGCTALQGFGLKTEYTEDALPRIYNRPLFTGKLCISGIYLARSLGHNKKTLKHEVYDEALKVLTQNTVAEINELRDPGMESLKATIELFLKEDVKGMASSPRISMESISQKLKEKMQLVNNQQFGLKKLVTYLKTTPNLPENKISQLEQGIQASKCNLPHSFECTEERGADGEKKFVGAFMFGDLCIARGEDEKFKKQCKETTYNKAVEALLNKPLAELLISVGEPKMEEEPETVVQEEETGLAAEADKMDETGLVKNRLPPIKSEPIEGRLKEFMRVLNTTAFQEDNIHNMDNLAHHFNLTIMCLFRKASPTSEVCSGCELYIENYLIATGYGESKKDCQLEAYSKAWETLTMYSAQDILTQHKKLNPDETAGPSVMEVFIKGATGIQRESNLHSLRRYGLDPYDETKKPESMVIVECADWNRDRKFNAFCILQYSATANGMLLQWSCETVKNKHKPNYRYEKRLSDRLRLTMYLQSKEIAMSEGPGKNKVRNNAAAIALFKMYETHDVIKVVKLKDEDRWIPFEQIEEECNTLRRKAGQPLRQKTVFEGWETKVDNYLITAVKAHMSRFFPREDAEELLFGPGIPNAEIKVIQAYASSLKLRCDTRQFNEETYLVVYHRQDMQKVVQELKKLNGGNYGKYKLVPRDELPNSDSIKHLMKGQQSL